MLYHLKIILRNLQRNGFYSAVHIIGLSVSLTAVIFIFLWVRDELSVDRYHKQVADTYLIVEHETYYGADTYSEYVPWPFIQMMKEEIPEIKEACATSMDWRISFLEYGEHTFFDTEILIADTTLFRIFDYTFLEGDPKRAFLDPSSIVFTDRLAQKIFGGAPALGEMIKSVDDMGNIRVRQVSAVVSVPQKKSALEFEAVIPALETTHRGWGNWNYNGYILLHPNADIGKVGQKMAEICTRHYEGEFSWEPFVLFPLAKYNLYSIDGKGGKIVAVRLFILMGIVLMLMACVNYVNLITARAMKRRREIVIKKSIGATRWRLFKQVLFEAIFLFLIAICTTIVLIYLFLPLCTILIDISLSPSLLDPYFWLLTVSAFVAITLLAGLYPAFLLSSFKILGTSRVKSLKAGDLSLRNSLVVFQFVCSIVFILATLIMGFQFRHIQQESMKNQIHDIFTVDFGRYDNISNHLGSFLSDLRRESAILNVAVSNQHIMNVNEQTDSFEWEGMPVGSTALTTCCFVNSDFQELIGLHIVDGDGFTGTPADSSRILLNETAVKRMGIEDPVGKRFKFWEREFYISGVVKDFHFAHMREVIEPMVILIWDSYSILYVKFIPEQIDRAFAAVEKVWRQYDADSPLRFRLMGDTFADLHKEDKQMTVLFYLFAILAILISCLGLFGLVTFTAETRTKEIGVRKVLGANVKQIVSMLSKEFLILVGIAMMIAFPLAYYWLDRMLQSYAYRIGISWWIFALAGIITVVLTLLTVGWKAFKAASANPVKSIKTE